MVCTCMCRLVYLPANDLPYNNDMFNGRMPIFNFYLISRVYIMINLLL